MKDHGLTVDFEQKQQVAARYKKSTDHRNRKMGSPRPVAFRLYGIDTPKAEHQLGSFYLYGLELGQTAPFRLYGIGQDEYQSSPFELYGAGRGQTD